MDPELIKQLQAAQKESQRLADAAPIYDTPYVDDDEIIEEEPMSEEEYKKL